jgi:hypothetical protein
MMVQSRFHNDDDADLHEQILRIEAYIEELADVVESCRKIILVSKFGHDRGNCGCCRRDGLFGSNKSTLKQTTTDMKAAEARRAELISKMDLRVVGDGKIEN